MRQDLSFLSEGRLRQEVMAWIRSPQRRSFCCLKHLGGVRGRVIIEIRPCPSLGSTCREGSEGGPQPGGCADPPSGGLTPSASGLHYSLAHTGRTARETEACARARAEPTTTPWSPRPEGYGRPPGTVWTGRAAGRGLAPALRPGVAPHRQRPRIGARADAEASGHWDAYSLTALVGDNEVIS